MERRADEGQSSVKSALGMDPDRRALDPAHTYASLRSKVCPLFLTRPAGLLNPGYLCQVSDVSQNYDSASKRLHGNVVQPIQFQHSWPRIELRMHTTPSLKYPGHLQVLVCTYGLPFVYIGRTGCAESSYG